MKATSPVFGNDAGPEGMNMVSISEKTGGTHSSKITSVTVYYNAERINCIDLGFTKDKNC
jgi:hypothetical protein